MSPISVLVSL